MSQFSDSALHAKNALIGFQKEINPIIEEFFNVKILEAQKEYPLGSVKALEVYKDITTRDAKRARAAFAYFVYKMYGGKNLSAALKMGVVLELTHSYLLLLDDFMDLSHSRRHGPTAHILLADYFKDNGFERGSADHFGDSIAVTVGAMGFHMAIQLLNDLDLPAEIKLLLSNNLNNKIETTAHGQITDVVNSHARKVSEENVLQMLKWKTGVYTYENPIHTGALLNGISDSRELAKLSEYAIPGGISFQIQDDILGMFGNESELGKATTDDLKEGKYTLLIHKALEFGDEKQRRVVLNNLGNKDLKESDHEAVKKVLMDTGSLEYSRELAQKLVRQAKHSLLKNRSKGWYEDGFSYLMGIADYMIEREV